MRLFLLWVISVSAGAALFTSMHTHTHWKSLFRQQVASFLMDNTMLEVVWSDINAHYLHLAHSNSFTVQLWRKGWSSAPLESQMVTAFVFFGGVAPVTLDCEDSRIFK